MTAIIMAAAMAVAPAPPAPSPTHEVQPGESLTRIAQCELGEAERWQELVTLNPDLITDPDVIEAGWQIVLPEEGTGDCPAPAAVQASSATSATVTKPSKKVAATQAPQRSRSGGASGGGLASVRACESGGDYGAVSSSGKYRGAYQFDQQTWESVGGSGDPAAASAEEQDQRAANLKAQRGSSPWPNCG